MPAKQLRSIVAKCSFARSVACRRRSFCSAAPKSTGNVETASTIEARAGKMAVALVGRCLLLGVGYGLGVYVYGHRLAEAREEALRMDI